MKKAFCFLLAAMLFTLAGCAGTRQMSGTRQMRKYRDGETFIVENGNVFGGYLGWTQLALLMFFGSLENYEISFKGYLTEKYEKMIVKAVQGESVSCYYSDKKNGDTYTDIKIEKVYWSNFDGADGLSEIKLREKYFYVEDENGELVFSYTGTPSFLLCEPADYYILYLVRRAGGESGGLDYASDYGEDWMATLGYRFDASTKWTAFLGGKPEGANIGLYSEFYGEVFHKYVLGR